jgi:hypothetical protein
MLNLEKMTCFFCSIVILRFFVAGNLTQGADETWSPPTIFRQHVLA